MKTMVASDGYSRKDSRGHPWLRLLFSLPTCYHCVLRLSQNQIHCYLLPYVIGRVLLV